MRLQDSLHQIRTLAGISREPYHAWRLKPVVAETAKREEGAAGPENDPEISKTILKQLGGSSKIRAMTGAKTFVDTGKGIRIQFPNRNAKKPNLVQIELSTDDTYKVTFGKLRGTSYNELKVVDGVYADDLRKLFTTETGLDLSL